ncbi:TetR/AcrR family transcriptional regulator C-terminal domain-containing protein [Nocardioides zeae]|uniref:TetR/AcrR family transcriptional regulator C-terminal domain-containing protein n=1 Tax=Nocardioides imazamoxiresistens TaxID=3231893 RepID=A0ABU3PRA6_9ACTN|nr:TetR family transcriptional regulator [Nocardioides zeae]MDT9591760.1 TetR/AcrR family transcriptional regulator C-terminal domain-containing protein [Nocardioides zeae]
MAAGRYHRAEVVARAVEVLDRYGLADLSMRRLGAELGVQPSALYHHFATKQLLLAAVADEILARRPVEDLPDAWDDRVAAVCRATRDAMLARTDGADVVATAYAFGLGARAPYDALVAALRSAPGADEEVVGVGARTLLHFVLGHVADEQTHLQAASAGAIEDAPRDGSEFDVALGIVLDGLRVRIGTAVAPG